MVTHGNSGNISANGDSDDPLDTIMIHWSYNGGNVDNNANDNNGSNGNNGVNHENNSIGNIGTNGSSGVVHGTNGIIEWQCVFHISHAPLHIEINDATGFIGAMSIIDTNGVNDDNDSPFASLDCQCC